MNRVDAPGEPYKERELIIPACDDGMIEVDWMNGTVEKLHLSALKNTEGFTKLFGRWRRISWSSSGQINGIEPRQIPVVTTLPGGKLDRYAQKLLGNVGIGTPTVKTMERLAKEKRRVLQEFAACGNLAGACRHAGVKRALFQSQVLRQESIHYDPEWVEQYEKLRRNKPWQRSSQPIAATA